MATSLKALAVSTLLAASMTCRVGAASAAPVIDHLAFTNAVPSTIEFAQWRGGWGWGWGAPVAGGFVAGALLGGALAAPYYYAPGPYYYPSPYYPPAPAGYYAPDAGPAPSGMERGLGMGRSGGRRICRRGSARRRIGGAVLLLPGAILLSEPLLSACAGRLLRSRP